MNNKIVAIIAVIVVVVAGAAAAVALTNNNSSDETNDRPFNMISRVNSEGSGVFIKSSVIEMKDGVPYRNGTPFYTVTDDGYTVDKTNAAAWGGLVFATPGTTSIQHVQMATLANQMGFEFKVYTDGMTKDSNTMYYYTNLSNFSLITADSALGVIDGGIIWEPQYQRIIQEKSDVFVSLALTNDLFPEHTCCIIVGNSDFLKNNTITAEKFLAGYAKAVDYVNNAIANPESKDYAELVAFTMTKVPGITEDEVKAAFGTITYLYADTKDGSLSALKTQVADLIDGLDTIGAFSKEHGDSTAIANKFVDDTYLKDALSGKDLGTEKASITVATITGDIHQIALHVAIEKGFFEEYGLTVNLASATNGGGISTAMLNGSADFGFLGAPPATTTTINSGLITA